MNKHFSTKKSKNPRRRLRQQGRSDISPGMSSEGLTLPYTSRNPPASRIRASIYRLPAFDSVLPDVLRSRFRYVHYTTMSSTNVPATATLKFAGNGPGHPLVGTNSHAPYGWNMANQFYLAQYTYACAIKVSAVCVTTGSTIAWNLSVRPQPSISNAGTTTEELELEKDHVRYAQGFVNTTGQNGAGPTVISSAATTIAVEGPFAVMANSNYFSATIIGTVPASVWTWLVQASANDDATPLTWDVTVELDYDVVLMMKITQTQTADH